MMSYLFYYLKGLIKIIFKNENENEFEFEFEFEFE